MSATVFDRREVGQAVMRIPSMTRKAFDELKFEKDSNIRTAKNNALTMIRDYAHHNSQDLYILMLVNHYFKTNETYTLEDLKFIYQNFCQNRITWLNSYDTSPNFIVEQLFMKIGVNNTYQTIIEVINSEFSVRPDQWMHYMNNYEEYKNMPVSWWINFIE